MATPMRLIGFLIIVLAAATLHSVAVAETFIVGGESLGWKIPSDDEYRDWAADKNFKIGDVLEFRWNSVHTVANVTKEEYDTCKSGNSATLKTTSPANFTINSPGSHYFICTIGTHCQSKQKVTVTVGNGTSTTPTTTTPPSSSRPSATTRTTTTTVALSAFVLAVSLSYLSLM